MEDTKETVSDKDRSPEVVVEELRKFARSEVLRKYGTGSGNGESPKEYHNLLHTDGVYSAAKKIEELAVENGRISQTDIPLVEIAAAFHDIEQDLGGGVNEEKSASIAEEQMRKAGIYSEEDITKVVGMILGTKVYFEDGILKQSATNDYLSKIVCDADLSSLGDEQDVYVSTSTGLLYEITKTHEPTDEQIQGHMKNQMNLLSNHQFYTDEATIIYPHQGENLVFAEKLVT